MLELRMCSPKTSPTTRSCEPYPLFLTCSLPHTEQAGRRVDPALSLGRGRPFGVLFGHSPSLHTLRRRFPAFVRALRRYSATVRPFRNFLKQTGRRVISVRTA